MRVLKQRSHTAIEIRRGTKFASLIKMDQQLTITEVLLDKVDQEWSEMVGYPVHRAAAFYLRSSRYNVATPRVISTLKEILMHYLIDRAGKVLSAGKPREVMQAFGELPEDQRLDEKKKAQIVTSAEDLKILSVAQLLELYNGLVEPENAAKKFSNKDEAAERTFNALELQHDPKVRAAAEKEAKAAAKEAEKAAKAAAKAEPKATNGEAKPATPRENSKMGRMVSHLTKGGEYSLEELSEASGYDLSNTRTAIGILRSKKNMPIFYNRESKTYSLTA